MRLILCGGGSGEQNRSANQKLNEMIDHKKPILYIPLAMDEKKHSYDSCYEWIQEELKEVDIPGIEMVRSFEDLEEKEYDQYSALFIGGGNTYQLLKGLKESNSFFKIQEYIHQDGIVIGGSAGAVIFGKDIDIIASMDPNDVGLKDTKGFDVLNGISIFPHYEKQEVYTKSIQEFSKTIGDVIAIPEEDAIFVEDEEWKVLGSRPFYHGKQGRIQQFNLGESFSLQNTGEK